MARRTRSKPDHLEATLAEVKERFQDGPLACICELLESELVFAQTALRGGCMTPEDAERLAIKAEVFINPIPRSFGPRFGFDTAMIKALSDEWQQGGTFISDSILPSHSDAWGHLTSTYARSNGLSVPLDLILFPGKDNLTEVNLLDYPFLCHEMGHNILFRHDQMFGPQFNPALEEFTRSFRHRAMADRGSARVRAQSTIDEISGLWKPSADHKNWSHEIAVDIIALWTCGPAYLATFLDILEAGGLDPYQIGQSHPPYEVRALALLSTSEKLGWAYYTGGIRDQIEAWRNVGGDQRRTNSYLTNSSPNLTRACVNAALSVCETLRLPLCTPSIVGDLDDRIKTGWTPDFGTELLLAAWLQRSRMNEDQYKVWEDEVKDTLYSLVRP